MNKLVRTSGILIPRSLENSENYTIIKKRLTRRGQVYNKSPFVINKFYVEGPSFLKIPRFYFCHRLQRGDNVLGSAET